MNEKYQKTTKRKLGSVFWMKHFLCLLTGLWAPNMFTWSFSAGTVPSWYKAAFVTPRLKMPGLGPSDMRSYRLISNGWVVSKLQERLVAGCLTAYLTSNSITPSLQAAFRTNHPTETTVLLMLWDILWPLYWGDLALQTYDMCASINTIDHPTLPRRLVVIYGIHVWLSSQLVCLVSERLYAMRPCRNNQVVANHIAIRAPQGSFLDPILFLLYTAELIGLIERNDLRPHLYANDSQIYGVFPWRLPAFKIR
jgi:hypothetical protein